MKKMTLAQERTLSALEKIGGWAVAKQIKYHMGHCASLPVLIEQGLVEKRDLVHPYGGYELTEWRLIK